MMRNRMISMGAAIAAALLLCPLATVAQTAGEEPQLESSRAELQARLAEYQASAQSASDDAERERARFEVALIEARLREGDFQTGDQIELVVEGEQDLTGTFTVGPNRTLVLPNIGSIPLAGVLRAEAPTYLREQLGRYLRDPIVHVRPLIRLSVLGEVNNPGFYMVPSHALLTDVLMQAGGPTRSANLTRISIDRSNDQIWGGEGLQHAIIAGRTLDELSLRAGDRVTVPEKRDLWQRLQWVAYAVPPLVYLLTQVF